MQKQEEDNKTKVLLTGGHAVTGTLGVIEEIKRRKLDWELYWIGPKSITETSKTISVHEKVLPKYGVQVRTIVSGKFLRRGGIGARLRAYLKIPLGFIFAFGEVKKINPDIVISFGGFAALPVVFVGFLFGKKIILHEQIVGAGLANKLSAPFASKILVARSESLKYYPKNKTKLIGNPQMTDFFNLTVKTNPGNPMTLFVTGGSAGAEIINSAIGEVLNELLAKYKIIHQTGPNNLDKYLRMREEVPDDMKKRYEVFGYMEPNMFSECYRKADIVVSRGGANTVADIVISKRPAVIIPLAASIGNEQYKNAMKAKESGIALLLEEKELSGPSLLSKIKEVESNWNKMVENVDMGDYKLDEDASKRLVDEVLSC